MASRDGRERGGRARGMLLGFLRRRWPSRPRGADGLSARETGKPSRDLLDYALPMNRFRIGSVGAGSMIST